MPSPVRSLLAVALVGSMWFAGCGSGDAPAPVELSDAVTSAETLCPVMWDWVTDMGELFNVAADDVRDLGTGTERRVRWFEAFAAMEQRNAELLGTVGAWREDALLAPLVAEIERDVPLADEELDAIRALFDEFPALDDERHQERTQQVIVRIEKVIDLPKPALGPLDPDGQLIAGFRTVPSCQHAVKDVNDGVPRSND